MIKHPVFPLALLLALAPVPVATTQPVSEFPGEIVLGGPPAYSRLRGITHFYIEVTSTGGATGEGELRNELRDLIELELRRANITVRTLTPTDAADVTPVLHLNVRLDRTGGMGRPECVIELNVRDRVSIVRNKEQINATIFELRRPAGITVEQTFARDMKNRTRELMAEFIKGMKKNNP
ncbi:MAG: hypothetical protein LBD14_00815 [Puniceicoccales bacterium]|jgi:hypothetical protein|nr:hypothetical protein [Puniceicoccales bacterium]